MIGLYLLIVIALILTIGAVSVLVSFIGAWLWNITISYIFGLPEVEWWHILALIILISILIPSRGK